MGNAPPAHALRMLVGRCSNRPAFPLATAVLCLAMRCDNTAPGEHAVTIRTHTYFLQVGAGCAAMMLDNG